MARVTVSAGLPAAGKTTFEEYALYRIGEDINETSPDRIKAMVEGPIASGLTELVVGDGDRAMALLAASGEQVWRIGEIGERAPGAAATVALCASRKNGGKARSLSA